MAAGSLLSVRVRPRLPSQLLRSGAHAPSLKDFERFVQQKTKELQDKGGNEIEYSVSVEGGRVKLKARVSS